MRKTLRLIRLRIARLWWVMIVVSLFGTALGYTWWHFNFLDMEGDERNAYDDGLKRFNNKPWFPWGKTKISDEIVLVGIDQPTFDAVTEHGPWRDRYGSWPYDRIIWKDVIEYLDAAGAKLVVFDFTLAEPKADITGDVKFGEAIDYAKVPTIMGFGSVERTLGVAKAEKPVNRMHQPKPRPPEPEATDAGAAEEEFGEFPTEPTPEERKQAEAEAAAKVREAAGPAFAFPVVVEGGLQVSTFEPIHTLGLPDGGLATGADLQHDAGLVTIEMPRFPVPPIPSVIEGVSGFGAVELEEDEDGKMRGTHFIYTEGENNYLTLAVAAAADYYQADKVVYGPGRLIIGKHTVRINPDGTARINYGGTLNDRFRSVSLSDVLRYKLAARDSKEWVEGVARFKGKIVFIGAIAQGTGDEKPTPFNSKEPGVMKHMATLDNIIQDEFILEAPDWGSLLLAFLVALISVALVMVAQSFITDVGAPVALTFAFFLITGGYITLSDVHVLSAMPGMAGTLAALFATTYNRFLASKDRERFRDAVGAYLHDDLVEDLAEMRKPPPLAGHSKEVTAFFSDIRGYSAITEQLKNDPQVMMNLLCEYFDVVVPALKEEGALIDKYIGDAVVAVFGAPTGHTDHAVRACMGALAVQKALKALNADFEKRGWPALYTRVGINTDTMWVGTIGSRFRPFSYTAMGDGMNLAARLEATNKAYDTLILIGPNTYELVKDKFATRELDSIRVAGKTEVLVVYELLGMPEQVSPTKRQVLDLYSKALELYRHKRFAESLKTLKDAYDLDSHDGPVKVLAGKCNQFMQHPPPADWDGVTQLEK